MASKSPSKTPPMPGASQIDLSPIGGGKAPTMMDAKGKLGLAIKNTPFPPQPQNQGFFSNGGILPVGMQPSAPPQPALTPRQTAPQPPVRAINQPVFPSTGGKYRRPIR